MTTAAVPSPADAGRVVRPRTASVAAAGMVLWLVGTLLVGTGPAGASEYTGTPSPTVTVPGTPGDPGGRVRPRLSVTGTDVLRLSAAAAALIGAGVVLWRSGAVRRAGPAWGSLRRSRALRAQPVRRWPHPAAGAAAIVMGAVAVAWLAWIPHPNGPVLFSLGGHGVHLGDLPALYAAGLMVAVLHLSRRPVGFRPVSGSRSG